MTEREEGALCYTDDDGSLADVDIHDKILNNPKANELIRSLAIERAVKMLKITRAEAEAAYEKEEAPAGAVQQYQDEDLFSLMLEKYREAFDDSPFFPPGVDMYDLMHLMVDALASGEPMVEPDLPEDVVI